LLTRARACSKRLRLGAVLLRALAPLLAALLAGVTSH
jgi:hypothetical protein